MKRWHWIGILILVLTVTVLSGCKPKAEEVAEIPAVEKTIPQSMEYLTITARCEADTNTSDLICLLPDGDQTFVGNLISNQAARGWVLSSIAQGEVDIFVFQRPFSNK